MNSTAERFLVVLGYVVTVVTAVSTIITAVGFVLGILSSPVEVLLAVALAISFVGNLFLLVRWAGVRRRLLGLRRAFFGPPVPSR